MKGYTEIRDIIVNQLGLRDQASYKAYIDQFHRTDNPRIPTPEEIALLDPDTIDNNAFWRVAEEIFKTDPVSNCSYGEPRSTQEANRANLRIYHDQGFTGKVEAIQLWGGWKDPQLLEIGPGYGAFKDWLSRRWSYFGADCYPKTTRVDQTLLNGLLSDVTKARTYNVVIASNVFQHLSVKQRRAYYRDIAGCLRPNGIFMVSMFALTKGSTRLGADADGRIWLRHYGQFTEIQPLAQIIEDLRLHFTVETTSISRGDWAVLECTRRDPAPNPDVS